MSMNYRAFISYSHADRKWARWLHRTLESYRTPSHLVGKPGRGGPVLARLTPIFRDRDDLASSPDLSERILGALQNSENLIIICSTSAATSRWVNEEIIAFKKLGLSRHIYCLIVNGNPAEAGSPEDCFPPALRARYDDDGNLIAGEAEPIAADLRRLGDGKKLARQKIVAGLLDIELDDLRRRELQRRHRRLTLATAASMAGVVFTASLAFNAIAARDEADQRREQAEDLLGFMVGDLRTSLEPIGRLDLLEQVGDRAMAYFATLDVSLLTENELLRHAQVLTQLGKIQRNQNNYAAALTSFSEAYERSMALYRKDPLDGDRLFNRGQAEYWVGWIHWRIGSLADARDWFTRYRATSLELLELDPDSDDWIREVGLAHHNLAVLAEEQGDLAAAHEGYTFLLTTLEELQQRDDSDSLIEEKAEAISFLGNVARQRGQLFDARSYYQESAEQLRGLWEKDTGNAINQLSLAEAYSRLASSNSLIGNLQQAIQIADESIELFDELAMVDASNTNLIKSLARVQVVKGEIMAAQTRWNDARELSDDAIATLEDLVSSGANDLGIYEYLGNAYLLQAWIAQENGDLKSALAATRSARETMQVIEQAGRMDEDRTSLLAKVYIAQNRLFTALGNMTDAGEPLTNAEELLKDAVDNSLSPPLLDSWARVLYLTDRLPEAENFSAQLLASGYIPLRAFY